LFTVAYEILGSAADAEDIVQESWLQWADIDHSQVRDPRAYLIRVVTRQALNQMRTLSRRREEYVGEWLPEPLLTSPDVAEVFEMSHGDIADAIGKSAVTVRQIARRAREHVAARRPRAKVSRSEQQAVVERFLLALPGGGHGGERAGDRVYVTRNPRKLAGLDETAKLAR
jgi:RNA polymerase sigma-70 factor, ECF subfamily